jgi:hypothetical protein
VERAEAQNPAPLLKVTGAKENMPEIRSNAAEGYVVQQPDVTKDASKTAPNPSVAQNTLPAQSTTGTGAAALPDPVITSPALTGATLAAAPGQPNTAQPAQPAQQANAAATPATPLPEPAVPLQTGRSGQAATPATAATPAASAQDLALKPATDTLPEPGTQAVINANQVVPPPSRPVVTAPPAAAQTTPHAVITGSDIVPGSRYRLQVGSFTVARYAVNAFDRLSSAGLNPSYERNENYYRVVITNVKAEDVDQVAAKLAAAGFTNVMARLER